MRGHKDAHPSFLREHGYLDTMEERCCALNGLPMFVNKNDKGFRYVSALKWCCFRGKGCHFYFLPLSPSRRLPGGHNLLLCNWSFVFMTSYFCLLCHAFPTCMNQTACRIECDLHGIIYIYKTHHGHVKSIPNLYAKFSGGSP